MKIPTSISNVRFAIPTIFDSSAASGSPAAPKPAGSPAAGAGVVTSTGGVTPAQVTGAPIMTSLLSGKDVQPKSPGNHEDEDEDGESNNMLKLFF